MKRRTDPDFELEPWLSTLIEYCMFGGSPPPERANAEPLEPSRTYVPPKAPPKRRKAAPQPTQSPPPPPPAKTRQPRRDRQPPSPPPPPPTFDFDGWRKRLAEQQARLEPHLRALGRRAAGVPEPFRVLGAPYPCTADELRARWREVAFQHHPDRGGDIADFLRLKKAYEEAKGIQEGGPFVSFNFPG